jgi:Protein of unknown function (DUF3307)
VSIPIILWVIFAHWIADFVCQSNWMASNKSKDWWALTLHVATYCSIMMLLLGSWVFEPHSNRINPLPAIFLVVTFAAHFITDAITSRITSRLFVAQFEQKWLYARDGTVADRGTLMKRGFSLHWFFVVIGFDQFLQYAQLFLTLQWLLNFR